MSGRAATGDPVLVGQDEASEILGVTAATFARLCREAKFQNMCWGGQALYRSAELRSYRAQDKRRVGSPRSVTNAISGPREAATLNGTAEHGIAPQTRSDPGLGNGVLWEAVFGSASRRPHLLPGVQETGVADGQEGCGMSERLR